MEFGICNRYILDSELMEGRQSCDNTLIERRHDQCQQYRTELNNSCGKVEGYL